VWKKVETLWNKKVAEFKNIISYAAEQKPLLSLISCRFSNAGFTKILYGMYFNGF